MKKFINLLLSAVYSLSTFVGAASLVPVRVAAESPKSNQNASTVNTTNTAKSEVVYKYVAQPGDSYSKIARKAIQTYAKKNKIKLSNAKIIAAETWMTQASGSPSLQLQESIQVQESSVASFVSKAQKLDAGSEARWNVFTAHVNFNTDAVGQTLQK